jgi:fatty acid desaturase
MDPVYAVPAFIVFTITGIIVIVKIVTSPYRGAKHVYKSFSPKADKYDRAESREILRDTGSAVGSYLGFIFTFLLILLIAAAIAVIQLPYFVNLVLGLIGAGILFLAYVYFQNRI